MDIQEIEVVIGKNGEVTVRVRGAKGKTCLSLTEGLEKALGNDIASRTMTFEADEDGMSQGQGISQSL